MSKKHLICFVTLILCVLGIIMVNSASNIVASYKYNDSLYYTKRQGLFLVLGIISMFIISKIDYHVYLRNSSKLLFISFILLLLVLIPGLGQIRGGSRSWFSLGPFSFQPAEVFKVCIIFYLSHFISKNYHKTKKIKVLIIPLFILVLGFALIMLQPDFGSGFIMIASGIILLFISRLPLHYFLYLGIVGIIGSICLIAIAPYRLKRLLSFLDPFSDPLGSGFQAIQSLFAIGPGGLLGKGFNNSIQKHFYLPEPQTDFIFAIFCEEFGLIGCIGLISLYIIFVYLGMKIALASNDLEGFYLAFGITILIGLQTVVNLCVVTSLFPITGITLPIISYGGTSLVVTLMCIGIIINISKHK